MRILQTHRPDFVALQESTKPFHTVCNTEWVREHYSVSQPQYGEGYGTLILSGLPCEFHRAPLPTRMQRDFLAAVAQINGQSFIFSTVHLESLDSPRARASQLREISRLLEKSGASTAILCGDFNFDANTNFMSRNSGLAPGEALENAILAEALPRFTDLWAQLRPDQQGFTFDTTANAMLRKRPRARECMRYDRVMLSSPLTAPSAITPPSTAAAPATDTVNITTTTTSATSATTSATSATATATAAASATVAAGWVANSIEMVGTEPFKEGVLVSDHFGLLAHFSVPHN